MISIEKWAGLVTNASPYAIPPGAAVTQVNLQCLSPGQLNVRPGLQAVTFSSTVAATQSIISAFNYQRSVGGGMVYQDAVGNVYTVSVPAGGLPPSFSGVPGIPRNLTATAGNATADLDWDEPEFSGGGGVSGYSIQRSPDGGATWTFAASSPTTAATISGLLNGTAYVFRVASTNQYGIGNYTAASNSVTPLGAPGSPTNLSATAGNAQAVLSWTAPASNGGSAITDYVVQFSGNGGTTWTTFSDGTSAATSATVTGLTNGSPYVFRVAAVNAISSSAYVAWMTPISPLGVPDQVASLAATHGNATVALLWTAPPANHQGGITDYAIQQSTDGGTSWTTVTDGASTDTSYTVTGLTNGSSYRYRVAAINAVGTGPYSSATAAVIPRTVPGAPTALTGTAGNAQVELSWTAPASNGGAAITDYKIEVSVNGGAYTQLTKSASASTSYTATGLTNGSTYRYRVSAVNSEGAGTAVTGSNLTPQTVPLAPTDVTGTPGNGLVLVRWTAPANDGGSAVIDYVIQYSTNSGSTWTTYSDGSSTNTQTSVSGLTNGTSYTFRVAAVSSAGTGNYSTASASFTPVGPPPPPTGVVATGGSARGQLNVSWTPPASNGGSAITGYVVRYIRTNGGGAVYGNVGNVTSAVISGLQDGVEYYVLVASVNIAGTGEYSSASNSVTVFRVPNAPTSLTRTAASATSQFVNSITLQWTLATQTYGSQLVGHIVQVSENGTAWTSLPQSGASNSATFANSVDSFKSYYFRVAAVSTVGPGPYSAAVQLAALTTVPNITSASFAYDSPSEGKARVTWSYTPDAAGTPLTSAYVQIGQNSGTTQYYDVLYPLPASYVDVANSRATFPWCTSYSGYRAAVTLVNARGAATRPTSIIAAPSGSTPSASGFTGGDGVTIVSSGRYDNVAYIDVLAQAAGCALPLSVEYSSDAGSTWTSTTFNATGGELSATGRYSKADKGLTRLKVAVPTSSVLLRARLQTGASTYGAWAQTGSPLSKPSGDPLWDYVMFLWDANVRTLFYRDASGNLLTAVHGTAKGQSGQFGALANTITDAPAAFAPASRAFNVCRWNANNRDWTDSRPVALGCFYEFWMYGDPNNDYEFAFMSDRVNNGEYPYIGFSWSGGRLYRNGYRAREADYASGAAAYYTRVVLSAPGALGGSWFHVAATRNPLENWVNGEFQPLSESSYGSVTAVYSVPTTLPWQVESFRVTSAHPVNFYAGKSRVSPVAYVDGSELIYDGNVNIKYPDVGQNFFYIPGSASTRGNASGLPWFTQEPAALANRATYLRNRYGMMTLPSDSLPSTYYAGTQGSTVFYGDTAEDFAVPPSQFWHP